MKKSHPCRNKDEVEQFTSVYGKCLGIATETRRVKPWPLNGEKFKTIHLCANCAAKFDNVMSEAWGEALGS